MLFTIENERLSVSADTHGAQLQRVYLKASGTDVLWTALPGGWPGRAPILFPIVGGLRNGQYRYQGKIFSMNRHGFARNMEFEPGEQTDNSISYILRDTGQTRAQYPFAFRLQSTYTLTGRTIAHRCELWNTGKETMYFSLGFHPAFFWGQGDFIELKDTVLAQARYLDPGHGHLLSDIKVPLPFENGRLYNTPALYPKGSWTIEDCPGKQVALVSPSRGYRVSVDHDAPFIGLWGGPGAPFTAIEPWYGTDDPVGASGNLEEKPHIRSLPPRQSWHAEIRITVLPLPPAEIREQTCG